MLLESVICAKSRLVRDAAMFWSAEMEDELMSVGSALQPYLTR